MKVLISGGGTAGHINPALAIAARLRDIHNTEILFIGTEKGLESELVPKAGFKIEYIEVSGLIRKLTLKNITVVRKYLSAISKCKKIIKDFQPDVVVGTGGYVCAPVMQAAHSLKIPSLIHEQNVIPGVTVKMCAKTCDVLATSFSETTSYLSPSVKPKCVLTGNPIRENMLNTSRSDARRALSLDERPLVVIFGGSLGAAVISNTTAELINSYDLTSVQLIFGTGKRYYASVLEKVSDKPLGYSIKVVPYINNMEQVLPAADLVVSRAGALTVSELTALGVPSVLIPSPNVAHNHQTFNARALEADGAAVMLPEAELTAEKLYNTMFKILNDKTSLSTMAEKAKKIGICDGTKQICDHILRICNK